MNEYSKLIDDIVERLGLKKGQTLQNLLQDAVSKATLEKNDLLLKSIRDIEENDKKDINIEVLIRDYLAIGDLSDVSIDYSFVKNKRLKRQLTIDNIQMEKERLGMINGSPNFIQFCKYAHFQLEGITSYFIYKITGNKITEFSRIFPNVSYDKKIDTIWRLTHSNRSYAVNHYFGIDIKQNKFGSTRLNTAQVRNRHSHRGIQEVREEFREHKERDTDFYIMKFILSENFIEVKNAILDLVEKVKNDLNNK